MLKIIILFFCLLNISAEKFDKFCGNTCNSPICLTGLETCITNNCYGARDCKAIIDQDYPTCSQCVTDILDPNTQATVGGNTNDVEALTILQNGDLASGSDGRTIIVWNVDDGTIKRTLSNHTSWIASLTTLPNGDLVKWFR
jgi:WD40 repeat protein